MTKIKQVDPPYQQIAAHFRNAIKAGELAVGERLPSIREIATEWGVSHMTASKALDTLVQEGLVARRRGTGAVVADHPDVVTVRREDLISVIKDALEAGKLIPQDPYLADYRPELARLIDAAGGPEPYQDLEHLRDRDAVAYHLAASAEQHREGRRTRNPHSKGS